MLSTVQRRTLQTIPRSYVKCFSSTTVATDKYDVVVVGGGPGGYVAAIKAAQLGLKTACVESRGALGGTCLNVGCIPSKALLHSTHLYEHALKDFAHHGINVGSISVDLKKLMDNKAKAVKGLTGGIEMLFKKNKVDYVKGFGKLAGPNSVSVELNGGGSQTIEAKNIILAVGSEVSPLPTCVVDNSKHRIVDSTGALDLPAVPKKMVVVGGGVIGLEMGSVWRRLGAEVTVVEFLDTITPGIDKETTQAFLKILKKQGIKFLLSTKVTASQVVGDGVKLTLEPSAGGAATTFDADVVLVSTGRRPFTRNIGLEALGIETDKVGRIKVDSHFQTKVPSIFAIGDAIDGPMLAHKAEEEGIACVENIAGFAGHVNYDAIPGVVYTYPELATVGQTEEQLIKAGIKYNKGVFPFQIPPEWALPDGDMYIRRLPWSYSPNAAHIFSPSVTAVGSKHRFTAPAKVVTGPAHDARGAASPLPPPGEKQGDDYAHSASAASSGTGGSGGSGGRGEGEMSFDEMLALSIMLNEGDEEADFEALSLRYGPELAAQLVLNTEMYGGGPDNDYGCGVGGSGGSGGGSGGNGNGNFTSDYNGFGGDGNELDAPAVLGDAEAEEAMQQGVQQSLFGLMGGVGGVSTAAAAPSQSVPPPDTKGGGVKSGGGSAAVSAADKYRQKASSVSDNPNAKVSGNHNSGSSWSLSSDGSSAGEGEQGSVFRDVVPKMSVSDKVIGSAPTSVSAAASTSASTAVFWRCSMCTMNNDHSLDTCEACGIMRA